VGLAKDVVRYAVSRDKSEFIRLKDVPRDTAVKLIMASAAIPCAFKPMEYQGRRFYDGGMGDRVKAQGNTPVEPLVKAGCTHAIVVIIGNGVPWDRYEWPDLTVLEIRPSKVIDGMLDFDPARIRALIALGEQDATRSLARFAKASAEVQGLMRAHQGLERAIADLERRDPDYDDIVRAIRNGG
jgi:NTE family protein